MRIFTGEIPSNPYVTPDYSGIFKEGQASILSQMKEVDINKLFEAFCEDEVRTIRLHDGVEYYGKRRFEQYILEAGLGIWLIQENSKEVKP